MKSKLSTNDFIDIIKVSVFLGMLVHYAGLNYVLEFLYGMLKLRNSFLLSLYNTSILNIFFKYFIAFPIVGIILSYIGSPRGKKGHYIGKVLYFIVGYAVGFILDLIASFIF